MSHSVDLGGRADQTRLRIGFELSSDQGLEFGGWTIDDVCLLAPDTPANRLGITDFVAEATSDTSVRLSLTAPTHRPVRAVRVVRRLDRYPTDHDDGEIAESTDEVSAGEELVFEDINGHSGLTYYAAYAYDGDDWLPWTEEGWNAATVTLVGGTVPPRIAGTRAAARTPASPTPPSGGVAGATAAARGSRACGRSLR